MGTAVRTKGDVPAFPAVTNLTVQQLYKLELAGLWPLGIAMGNCSWYDRHADCSSEGNWNNREMYAHTGVIEQAQHNASARFKAEVVGLNALGAVNVEVKRHFHQHEWEANERSHTAFLAEVMLLGTAVHRRESKAIPRPKLVLDLGGGKTIDLGPKHGIKSETAAAKKSAHAEFTKREG